MGITQLVAAHSVTQKRSNEARFGFVDNRPEALRKKTARDGNNSPQAKQVVQLQKFETIQRTKNGISAWYCGFAYTNNNKLEPKKVFIKVLLLL